jgi:hypothetical protein
VGGCKLARRPAAAQLTRLAGRRIVEESSTGAVVAAHLQRRRARSRTGSLAGTVGSLVAVLALLSAGCATPTVELADEDPTDAAADGGTEVPSAENDVDAAPPPEPSDPDEAVDPGVERLRFDLPGVPAGGSAEYVAADLQCVEVNWSDPPDLVDGVRLSVTAVDFAPQGVYELVNTRCPGPHPPCLPDWLGADICTVAVGWTGQPSTEDGELFFTRVLLACESIPADTCRAFAREAAAAEARGPALRPFPDPEAAGAGGTGADTGRGGGPGGSDAGEAGDTGGSGSTGGDDVGSADVGENEGTDGPSNDSLGRPAAGDDASVDGVAG